MSVFEETMEKAKKASEELSNQEELVSENQAESSDQANPDNWRSGEDTDPEAEEDGLKKAQDEALEIKDKYLRLYSEFENFRRRTSKEKLEMIQSANEQLIKSLLPVADDFERAKKAMAETSGSDAEGFMLIQNKLKKILEQYGVRAMAVEVGSDFDPDTQEAITQIAAPEEDLKGKVVDIIEKGYMLNDKVIRYAKVVVGN
jgi:molecular chaperone GrpE